MFLSNGRLPHLLSPDAYYSSEIYRLEMEKIVRNAWHVVGTLAELAKPGDFLTREVVSVPVQVRNFDGEIRAFSNVCAHRHCLLTSCPSGNTSKMRCQFHGWEYQADGLTGRIPEPKNFAPITREQYRLPQYRLEMLGQLVLVNVADDPLPLREQLGDDFAEFVSQRFSESCSLGLVWEPEYPANWKVPIENSLEAYHVPAVHPRTFREDPGESRSEHLLLANRTAFGTELPFSAHTWLDSTFQRTESRIARWLGHETHGKYWQHHVFPNLLFSFTDVISLCHCVMPTGPTTSRGIVRQFGIGARPGRRFLSPLSRLWSRLEGTITKHILKEDLSMFSSIQRGLERSTQAGVLGRCEERIHAFQNYLEQRMK